MTRSLPRDHVPSEPCVTDRDRALNSVFTTALEGGIGYWATATRYRWSIGDEAMTEARDFIAVVQDTEVEDGTEYVIDRAVIARGIRKAYAHGGWNEYQGRALRDLNFGKWDDVDYDAITADLVVQFGLFGSELYS